MENVIIRRIKELIAKESSVIILLYYVDRLYGVSCYYYGKVVEDYKLRFNQLIKAENNWKELLIWLLALLPQDYFDRYRRHFKTVRYRLVAEIIIERLKELLREADEEAKMLVVTMLEPIII